MTAALFDQAPCGFFSFLDDGSLHDVNETLCRLLGYEKNELAGRNVETLFTLSTRIFYQTHFFPLVKMQGYAEELFLTLQTKDKQHLPVLLNAKRVELEGRFFTTCAFIVVHNRKKFEDELVAARKVAEKALRENTELLKAKSDLQHHAEQLDVQMQLVQKQNEELKQLNQAVTHDLREPMRKILVYTEKLQLNLQTENTAESLPQSMEKLSKASAQMRAIVSGLQQYVWLTDMMGDFKEVDLNKTVKQAQDKLHQELNADALDIKSNILPVLQGDAEQLELLFYHLLANAVKFKRGERATVSITATLIQQNRFKALEDKYKYEDFVRLEIRDEGVGFDPAFREAMFALFKRLHFAEGRGLGLALCKKIVDNHRGTITADSLPNEYTLITVTLPLTQFHRPS